MNRNSVVLTRRFYFCAAHYYRVEEWSDEKNREVFGVHSNPTGHGHNFVLDVSVKGEIDPVTGMIINLTDLKRIVAPIVERFDHTFLNKDLPFFKDIQPTVENLSKLFWELIEERLPDGVFLHRIRLKATEKVFAEYYGDGFGVFCKKYRFSAGHRLFSKKLSEEENKSVYGKCNNFYGHGHNYYLKVCYCSEIDETTGMTIPLSELDKNVKSFLKTLSGKRLDKDIEFFKDKPATSENLLIFIKQELKKVLGNNIKKLELSETRNNFFEFLEDKDG